MSFFESYQQTVFFAFPKLTAPGSTDVVDVYVPNYLSTRNYTLTATVNNINSRVVVRLDGTTDGSNFGAMISNEILRNGTYAYNVAGFPMKKLRATFFDESGGTDAEVTFTIAAN
jgi:hypothetical protein